MTTSQAQLDSFGDNFVHSYSHMPSVQNELFPLPILFLDKYQFNI